MAVSAPRTGRLAAKAGPERAMACTPVMATMMTINSGNSRENGMNTSQPDPLQLDATKRSTWYAISIASVISASSNCG